MGVSTDGILFYGIAYGEDLDVSELAEHHGIAYEDFDFDFETLYADKMGVKSPTGDYDLDPEVFKKYWADKREINKKSGCEIGTYCSGDYPMYYLAIKDGHYSVSRGSETEIPDGLTAKPEWKQQLELYCAFMGLPFKEPKWLLVSYWG